jgi:hypothetical protein
MKKIIIILLLLVFSVISSPVTGAEKKVKEHKLGVGICVGEPMGMSFKYWFTKKNAVGIALGWQGKEKTYFHVDYLTHNYESIPKGELSGEVSSYSGVGVSRTADTGNSKIICGIRVVFGINYLFKEMPVDIFAELAPTVITQPETTGLLAASMGVRYYFE